MLLTPEQIEELTHYSRKRPTLQVKALRAMGVRHFVRPDGSAAVHVSALESRAPSPSAEPNWEMLDEN